MVITWTRLRQDGWLSSAAEQLGLVAKLVENTELDRRHRATTRMRLRTRGAGI